MRNKSSIKNNRIKYTYCCKNHANNWGIECDLTQVSEDILKETSFKLVKENILFVLELADSFKKIDKEKYIGKMKNLSELDNLDKQINDYVQLKSRLFERFQKKEIAKEEYIKTNTTYTKQIELLKAKKENLRQLSNEEIIDKSWTGWHEKYLKASKVNEISREMLIDLVERIDLYPNKQMKISFKYYNDYSMVKEYLEGGTNEQ